MSEEVATAGADLAHVERLQEQLNHCHLQARDARAALHATEAEAARLRTIASLAIEAWAELEEPLPIEIELSALAIALGETSAGRALLAELEAARAVVETITAGISRDGYCPICHQTEHVTLQTGYYTHHEGCPVAAYDAAVTAQRRSPPAPSQA